MILVAAVFLGGITFGALIPLGVLLDTSHTLAERILLLLGSGLVGALVGGMLGVLEGLVLGLPLAAILGLFRSGH